MNSILTSLSRQERFTYDTKRGFCIAIPDPQTLGYTSYPRACISHLKALLIPSVKLTRGGHLSQRQEAPPEMPGFGWWLAQIIHFGLGLYCSFAGKDEAVEVMRRQLIAGRLRVPEELEALERSLKRQMKTKIKREALRVDSDDSSERSDEGDSESEENDRSGGVEEEDGEVDGAAWTEVEDGSEGESDGEEEQDKVKAEEDESGIEEQVNPKGKEQKSRIGRDSDIEVDSSAFDDDTHQSDRSSTSSSPQASHHETHRAPPRFNINAFHVKSTPKQKPPQAAGDPFLDLSSQDSSFSSTPLMQLLKKHAREDGTDSEEEDSANDTFKPRRRADPDVQADRTKRTPASGSLQQSTGTSTSPSTSKKKKSSIARERRSKRRRLRKNQKAKGEEALSSGLPQKRKVTSSDGISPSQQNLAQIIPSKRRFEVVIPSFSRSLAVNPSSPQALPSNLGFRHVGSAEKPRCRSSNGKSEVHRLKINTPTRSAHGESLPEENSPSRFHVSGGSGSAKKARKHLLGDSRGLRW